MVCLDCEDAVILSSIKEETAIGRPLAVVSQKRILEDVDAGLSTEDLAVKYRVGRRTLNRLLLHRQ